MKKDIVIFSLLMIIDVFVQLFIDLGTAQKSVLIITPLYAYIAYSLIEKYNVYRYNKGRIIFLALFIYFGIICISTLSFIGIDNKKFSEIKWDYPIFFWAFLALFLLISALVIIFKSKKHG